MVMEMEPNEYELAIRARDGDREALAELVERLRMPLFSLAYADLRHYEDAQDAVASALLQICRHVGQLREPERVRAWMHQIVRNEVRQLLRSRGAQGLDIGPEQVDMLASEPGRLELRLDIQRALRQLPRDQARALTLFYLSGLSVQEIAQCTGRPQGTITRWLHLGRRQLAQHMEGHAPMAPDLAATIVANDLDPAVLQRLKDALHGAGFSKVDAHTGVQRLGDLYRVDRTDSAWPFPEQFHFSTLLQDSRFVLLDEWIAGRSAFELFSILKATPEGKNTAFGLMIQSPTREDSTVFAAWASGFDLCFARDTDRGVLRQWFARVREGLEKGWGWEKRRVEMAELVKASSKEFGALVRQVTDDSHPDYKGEGPTAGPIVRIAHTIIQQAIIDQASEIQVEPHADHVAIHFRVPAECTGETGSELCEVMKLPRHLEWQLRARYKYMADMNVEEQSTPHDGRIAISYNGRDYDLSVSSESTTSGERILIRIQSR
jgi:RNA polymerase sigma factor (sigma-70 family)